MFMLDSPPSSPKRNAAFSRFGPEVGLLPDLRKGEPDLGGDDLDACEMSGSNIHEKLDCAILDLVGTGAFGLIAKPSSTGWVASFCDSASKRICAISSLDDCSGIELGWSGVSSAANVVFSAADSAVDEPGGSGVITCKGSRGGGSGVVADVGGERVGCVESSGSGMVESSKYTFTNSTLAMATSIAFTYLSLSPSGETDTARRSVIACPSMTASC